MIIGLEKRRGRSGDEVALKAASFQDTAKLELSDLEAWALRGIPLVSLKQRAAQDIMIRWIQAYSSGKATRGQTDEA